MDEVQKNKIALAEMKARAAQSILDKGAEMSSDDYAEAKKLQTEVAGISEEIKALQEQGNLRSDVKASLDFLTGSISTTPNVVGFQQTGSTQITQNSKGMTVESDGEGFIDDKTWKAISQPEYKKAFRSYLRASGEFRSMKSDEIKILQEGSDPSGGFTVPVDFMQKLIQKEPTPTRVAAQVSRLTTSRDAIVIPKVAYTTDNLYTTGMRVTFTGEVPASSTAHLATDPVFANVRIPVYTAMISLPLTNDLIEDSAFPLESWVAGKFVETRDLLYDNMILNGNGTTQPYGILTNPGATGQPATTSIGNPVTADGLVTQAWTPPEQYDENMNWVFNKVSVGQAIAKLKDAQNRYLWGMGYQDSGLMVGGNGVPIAGQRTLLGYPVLLNGFMPNTGANNLLTILGDLRGYYLVERVGLSVQVLREINALTNQVVVLGRLRFGGQTCEDWKITIGKQA